jgi:fumarate reductase flavoprotein subunit
MGTGRIGMSEKQKSFEANLDRRGFLKGAAATAGITTIGLAQSSSEAKAAATKSWKDAPDPIDNSLITDGGKFDIIIVGGGTSGLLCARIAATKGVSVAIIENQAQKAYTWVGGEVGTVNSKWAQDHGAIKIEEEDFLRELARRNLCRHNAKHARYYVQNSGRIFDWVIKDVDRKWMAEYTHVMSCPPKPTLLLDISGWKFYLGTTVFRHPLADRGTMVWKDVMKSHHEKAMADGARWFFAHHAEVCDVDASGAVTGVVAKNPDGKYVRFKASKAVVLAAGDFGGNREMLLDINDEYRHIAESFGDLKLLKAGSLVLPRDGSGIKLGIWAGGHIEVGPRAGMNTAMVFGKTPAGPGFLLLNADGDRYCDEAAGGTEGAGYIGVRQPRGVLAGFMDANWQRVAEMMPPCHGSVDTAAGIKYEALIKEINSCVPGPKPNKSGIYCANKIEELIDYMGCFKDEARTNALAQIARYNELCAKGIDDDFGKDPRLLKASALKTPPFYGCMDKSDTIGPGLCQTAGLDTDAEGHVLNSNLRPIKRLYACGNNAGNRFIVQYATPIAGMSLGMAMTEGYMLGERLTVL